MSKYFRKLNFSVDITKELVSSIMEIPCANYDFRIVRNGEPENISTLTAGDRSVPEMRSLDSSPAALSEIYKITRLSEIAHLLEIENTSLTFPADCDMAIHIDGALGVNVNFQIAGDVIGETSFYTLPGGHWPPMKSNVFRQYCANDPDFINRLTKQDSYILRMGDIIFMDPGYPHGVQMINQSGLGGVAKSRTIVRLNVLLKSPPTRCDTWDFLCNYFNVQ